MGRWKVVSEDFVRRQRKRQEIGNKKRQKKLYETVYMHQVLRAPNQLTYFIRWMFCRFICKPETVNKPFFPINKEIKKLLNNIKSTITQF